MQITDSQGHPVYRKDSAAAGKFAFTSDTYDLYTICFATAKTADAAEAPEFVEVSLTLKAGVDARSYNDVRRPPPTISTGRRHLIPAATSPTARSPPPKSSSPWRWTCASLRTSRSPSSMTLPR